MKISADLTNEELEVFNQYKEENGFESSYKAIKEWIKSLRFKQEEKEIVIEKKEQTEFERLINILKS